MKLERTAVYVLSSIVVILGGLIVLLATGPENVTGVSIGTSLIAGGLASVAFGIIRYFDDRATSATSAQLDMTLNSFVESLGKHSKSLASIRQSLPNSTPRTISVTDRYPHREVGEEVAHISGACEVDVMGLTLRQFCIDWLGELAMRESVTLRLLLQDPTSPVFSLACRQEARDERSMRDDAVWVTRTVLELASGIAVTGAIDAAPVRSFRVEVKWFQEFPTVMITRVGNLLYARPRFLKEAVHPRTFFECYHLDDGHPFASYNLYYQTAWNSAKTPTITDCDQAASGGASGPTTDS
jgi:hypothetical protein